LLPLNADREEALKLRLDEQHRQVLEEIRNGQLYLPPPTLAQSFPASAATEKKSAEPSRAAENIPTPVTLSLELLNAKTWLTGKRASLHLLVNDRAGNPVTAAKVVASVSGAAEPLQFSAESSATGEAHLDFDMPRLGDANAALLIEASHGSAKGHLRFQLRARQRVTVS
jgi:hypothetical protein